MNPTEQFETIVSDYYQPLFKFALSLTHAEADARDLTQQTFFIWATKGHQLRDSSKVKTWLFTTLHRMFLQVRRRRLKFPHQVLEEISEQIPMVEPESYDHADTPQVMEGLAQLDEVYRAAVALFYLRECSYKEIAIILEVPMGTVKSRIARGLVALRKILMVEESNRGMVHEPEGHSTSLPQPSKSLEGPSFLRSLSASAGNCFPGLCPGNGT
jgi:RNA polymerase sigma-70 factor (ECF subfamily)